ncbi:MAG: hypothetical protein LBJ31_10460 [Treponema sp.]|nr:hypothetical protein [Treponema sp.]
MLQFYLLSIVLNVFLGCILAFCDGETEQGAPAFTLNNETLRLVAGGFSIGVGILKLLSPVANSVPVVGDLFPALANLAGGFILVFEFYRNRSSLITGAVERLGDFLEKNRRFTGFFCLTAAGLHFIAHQVLFL